MDCSAARKFERLDCVCYFCLLPKLPTPVVNLVPTRMSSDEDSCHSVIEEDPLSSAPASPATSQHGHNLSDSEETNCTVVLAQNPLPDTQEVESMFQEDRSASVHFADDPPTGARKKKSILKRATKKKTTPKANTAKKMLTLTPQQQTSVWERQTNNFMAFLFLV